MYGVFDTIGNTPTRNLAAYDGHTFIPVADMPVTDYQPITAMIVYKNKLIAAGNFDSYPASSINRVAQFDGTSWSAVGNGVVGNLSYPNTMAIYKDTLYIAGAFPKSAGNAGNNIMKWDGSQLYDGGWGGFCGYGAIHSLVTFRDRLYAFGNFMCAADQKAFGVAYYENGTWTVPQDSIQNNSIASAVVYKDEIYIAGFFKSINGDTTIQNFAKLVCPDFDAASGCVSALGESSRPINIAIYPNPSAVNEEVNIQFQLPSEKECYLTMTDILGKQVLKTDRTRIKDFNYTITTDDIQEGLYLLQVHVGTQMQNYKLIKR